LCTQRLEEKFEDIRSDMFVQTTNVGKLAHIQLKDRERDLQLGAERDQLVRSTMDRLGAQHGDLLQLIASFGKDIDDKMKDIRSLLLGRDNKREPRSSLVDCTVKSGNIVNNG
jgi:hypothetical protein